MVIVEVLVHGVIKVDPIRMEGNDVSIIVTAIKLRWTFMESTEDTCRSSKARNLSFSFFPGFLNAQAWPIARQLH